MPLRVAAVLVELALREGNRAAEMLYVALAQQVVLEHRAQRRRDAHRDAEGHRIGEEPLHHADEREITFGDGFEEPALLEKLLVLRVAHEWKVGVKGEREGTLTHRALFAQSARAAIG